VKAYYNEFDPFAAQWLRNLIVAGLIAPGDVDERSIEDVQPEELAKYTQCHFFAGIGGWSVAARLAGWPDDRELWTGSCPCQPFSVAGKRGGEKDERHLWPVFRELIAKRKPAAILGEQVASADGRRWFCGVRTDMEALGYAVGGADLCAAGIGAPHIRARLFWVADNNSVGLEQVSESSDANEERNFESRSRLVYPNNARLEGHSGDVVDWNQSGRKHAHAARPIAAAGRHSWGDNWVGCADGKKRRIEPGIEPLAHGISGRVGLLRGYGNAIVPQLAAEFMKAFLECRP
jgi:DNA (cytosine-5)-methyltransferase 1